MKNLRNYFAALALAAVLSFGVTSANAGIIVAGLTDNGDSCSGSGTELSFTGIIVAGFTGIIVAGAVEQPQMCGIIVAG